MSEASTLPTEPLCPLTGSHQASHTKQDEIQLRSIEEGFLQHDLQKIFPPNLIDFETFKSLENQPHFFVVVAVDGFHRSHEKH